MEINIRENGHDFEKKNLIALRDKKGNYDLYVCRKCGLKGKRRTLRASLEIRKNSNKEYCVKKPEEGTIIVKALCKDSRASFIDTFFIKDVETATQEVKAMLNWFNSTLKPYETPRTLVKIESIEDNE